jgi:hypothetical protein
MPVRAPPSLREDQACAAGVASGSIASAGGALEIVGSLMPAATIGEFISGDVIDLASPRAPAARNSGFVSSTVMEPSPGNQAVVPCQAAQHRRR